MMKFCTGSGPERFAPFARDSICPEVPGHRSWEELMRLADSEAARGEDAGEVPVGALVIDEKGLILSTAHNTCIRDCDVSAHAEISALRGAGRALGNYRLNGCYLVVTLEPCVMCAQAIVSARLAGLVFGACDSCEGAIVSSMAPLIIPDVRGSIWYMGGVLGDMCCARLRRFFSRRR